MTFTTIENTIDTLDTASIAEERKQILDKLTGYIQQKVDQKVGLNLLGIGR